MHNLTYVGVKAEDNGALLSSVLMSKLPAELKLIVSREIGEEEQWKLDSLKKVIETHICSREQSAMMEDKGGLNLPRNTVLVLLCWLEGR